MTDKLRALAALALTGAMWLGAAGTTVTLLSGCATTGGATHVGGDIVTDSDEPESRKRARLRLELAAAYLEKGQTTDALDHVKQSIAADPNMADAYSLRGLIYMRMNEMGLAEDSFKRALSISPRSSSVLHNYGWLMCQTKRYPESVQMFSNALANPNYGERAKTWMAQGLCQQRAGDRAEAEASLMRAYELDAGNPIVAYNLTLLLLQRGDLVRAQFYARRLNNSELANSESLWLGIKIERRLGNREAMDQLGAQLKKRFAQSREAAAYERGAFDE